MEANPIVAALLAVVVMAVGILLIAGYIGFLAGGAWWAFQLTWGWW